MARRLQLSCTVRKVPRTVVYFLAVVASVLGDSTKDNPGRSNLVPGKKAKDQSYMLAVREA